MSPTSYRAAPPRGDRCTVPQAVGRVNRFDSTPLRPASIAPNTDPSGRLLLLLGTRRRRLRLGRWRGRGGAADTKLVQRGVVELTTRGQAFLRLVVAERRRRTGAHHAIDRAGIEALVAKRLL